MFNLRVFEYCNVIEEVTRRAAIAGGFRTSGLITGFLTPTWWSSLPELTLKEGEKRPRLSR